MLVFTLYTAVISVVHFQYNSTLMMSYSLLATLCCCLAISSPSFVLCGGGNGSLNFLVLGDWGGAETPPFTTDIEDHTAKQMAITAQQTDAKFVVSH